MTAVEHLNIVRPLPLRVEDFLLLSDSGAFANYGKTELIDGGIVYMNAQHRPHARTKAALYDVLRDALRSTGASLGVLVEVTVSIPPHDAPEPDIVVTREIEGEGPVPVGTVALVVEVADTTLAADLGTKQQLYARAGVPEYWVADVSGRVVHQMWDGSAHGYAEQRRHNFGDTISAATLDGISVTTAALI